MESRGNTINRRAFITGSVAAAALTVAGTAGSALASEATNDAPQSWDMEADVVAVGGGGAGLACAIEACDLGLDVIVLESQASTGGDSIRCNGGMCIPGSPLQQEQGIEDSPEIMFQDLVNNGPDDMYMDFIETLCYEQAKLWDWLTGFGIEFKKESLLATGGQSRPREHHVTPAVVMGTLNDIAIEKGAQILLETRGTRLVQRPGSREVLGVIAEDADGNQIAIKARKGVALTGGGYGHNPDMLNKWVFGTGAEDYMASCFDSPGCDGSCIEMAQDLGADTRHMHFMAMLTVKHPEGGPNDSCSIYHGGAILVNQDGDRFVNESQGYTNVWEELNLQPGKVCYQIWDQPIYDQYRDNESSYYSMAKLEATDYLIKANTVEELAAAMEIPVEKLQATLDLYNSDVEETGVDSLFGRQTLISSAGVPVALNHPPYYAWKTTSVICDTRGGLKQDVKRGSRVISVLGDPIERLYVAGNASGYCNFGCIPGTRRTTSNSGVGFGGALAFGRYVADHIAELENWE